MWNPTSCICTAKLGPATAAPCAWCTMLDRVGGWLRGGTATGASSGPVNDCITPALHLAVFREPYLGLILKGDKTVESRFSVTRRAPFRRVAAGDIILLKRAAGPVVGACRVDGAWFYELDPATWPELRDLFTEGICPQEADFWDERSGAKYASLMQVADVVEFAPFAWPKRDRRGWVVLRRDETLFDPQ